MRNHLQLWAMIALLCVLPLGGCANPAKLGENYQRTAQAADDGIGVIDRILAEYPNADEAELLGAIRQRLPLDWQADFDWAYSRVGDARDSLVMVRDDILVTLRDEAQTRARAAFAQADKQADDFDNIVWSLGEIAAWAGGPTALAIFTALGLFRERRRTEDIVTSINDSPTAREAVKNAGDVIQNADTQKRVAAILKSVGA